MSVADARRPVAAPARPPRLLLLGNPNTGKTTLFNRLCGMRAKTANFPGTTTDLRRGRLVFGADAGRAESAVEVVDLPGLYSLDLDLPASPSTPWPEPTASSRSRRSWSPTRRTWCVTSIWSASCAAAVCGSSWRST
jgi:hypothetical protein